jgi:hypothetical protein
MASIAEVYSSGCPEDVQQIAQRPAGDLRG